MDIRITKCKTPILVEPHGWKDPLREALTTPRTKRDWKRNQRIEARRKRKKAEARILCAKGGETNCYFVGCGKCEICNQECAERKQNKWFTRLTGMIKEFRKSGFSVTRKGVEKNFMRGEVFFMTFTFSNENYPGASWCKRLSRKQITQLNMNPRFRKRCLREGRRMFHEMLHDSKYRQSVPYTMFTEFGTNFTRRLHLHAFFFVSGSNPREGWNKCSVLLDYWREKTKTTQGMIKIVEDDYMAANYITKYVLKTGAAQHRTMTSQFNWAKYEKKFALDRHGLDFQVKKGRTEAGYDSWDVTGGDNKWLVLEETVPLDVISEGDDVLVGLERYMDGLLERGSLVLPNLTHKPFGGIGVLQCVAKDVNILKRALVTTHELPAGCSLRTVPFSRRRLPPQAEHPVTRALSRLPRAIQAVLLDRYMSLGFGQDLLCKVSARVWKWYRTKFTRLQALPQ